VAVPGHSHVLTATRFRQSVADLLCHIAAPGDGRTPADEGKLPRRARETAAAKICLGWMRASAKLFSVPTLMFPKTLTLPPRCCIRQNLYIAPPDIYRSNLAQMSNSHWREARSNKDEPALPPMSFKSHQVPVKAAGNCIRAVFCCPSGPSLGKWTYGRNWAENCTRKEMPK